MPARARAGWVRSRASAASTRYIRRQRNSAAPIAAAFRPYRSIRSVPSGWLVTPCVRRDRSKWAGWPYFSLNKTGVDKAQFSAFPRWRSLFVTLIARKNTLLLLSGKSTSCARKLETFLVRRSLECLQFAIYAVFSLLSGKTRVETGSHADA